MLATPKTTVSHVYNQNPSPTAAAHPPLGTLIDNDSLELVQVLGVGGYGVVYRAIDTRSSLPQSYAVKCLVGHQLKLTGRHRQIHIREITLHQLASSHPNVVTLHRVVEDYNYTYIIMDYARDGDLFSQILHSCRYIGDDYLIKRVFLQLLDAVEYCHSLGIYHRDLKPENVLCFENGLRVAITDFGLATTDKVSDEFRTGSVYHMSPECQGGVFAPTGTYSPMFNDIWSLAIILLNLSTGRNPWKSASASDPTFQAYLKDPSAFLPTVLPISHQANSVLVRMLDIDWRNRITLPELRRAIQAVDTFYSDGVIFEGSMARCSWEAGMDIDSDSSTKEESSRCAATEELKSHWSKDSTQESDIVFAGEPPSDESLYARWAGYSPSTAAWGFESPISSTISERLVEELKMWESPATPPTTDSPVSSSFGSLPSLPVTPNNIDSRFGDRVNIAPPKALTLDTDCCKDRYRDGSMASFSTGSSMMQTAIDYDLYSSSFSFASSPSKVSLQMPSTVDLVDDDNDADDENDDSEPNDRRKDMDTASNLEYTASDMSYPSMYTRTQSFLPCEETASDITSATSPCSDTIVWPEFRAPPAFTSQPREIHVPPSSPKPRNSSPLSVQSNRSKKSYESKPKGTGIFKLFPRSPRSSLSPSRRSTFLPSRTPSPQPKQPWTFSPTRARTPAVRRTQDGRLHRTAGLVPKRHWFSPGKLFSANAS